MLILPTTLTASLSVVSTDPLHGEVYSIQHYVIKFVSDTTGQWFSQSTLDLVSSTNKADRHYIAEILLKVALSTLILTLIPLTAIIKAYICIHRLLQSEAQQTLVERGPHCKRRLGNIQCFCLFASKFNPFVGWGILCLVAVKTQYTYIVGKYIIY